MYENDLERLHKLALQVLGSDKFADEWFVQPQRVLGGAIPRDYAITPKAISEIENVLRKLEQGIIL